MSTPRIGIIELKGRLPYISNADHCRAVDPSELKARFSSATAKA